MSVFSFSLGNAIHVQPLVISKLPHWYQALCYLFIFVVYFFVSVEILTAFLINFLFSPIFPVGMFFFFQMRFLSIPFVLKQSPCLLARSHIDLKKSGLLVAASSPSTQAVAKLQTAPAPVPEAQSDY